MGGAVFACLRVMDEGDGMVAEAPQADSAVTEDVDPNLTEADPQGQAEVEGAVTASEETGGDTAVETPQPRSLAEFSDDELTAHLRERKNAEGLSLEERLRKSERDKTISEFRKNAAREENVKARERRWLESYGIDPEAVKPAEAQERALLFKLSEDVARTDVLKAYATATLDHVGADKSLAQALIEGAGDDPAALEDVTSRLVNAVRESVKTATLRESSLSDIPEGSALHGQIEARVTERVEAELKAREITESTADSPPTAPRGTPGVDATSRYRSTTAEEAARLPDSEYREWLSVQAAAGAR